MGLPRIVRIIGLLGCIPSYCSFLLKIVASGCPCREKLLASVTDTPLVRELLVSASSN